MKETHDATPAQGSGNWQYDLRRQLSKKPPENFATRTKTLSKKNAPWHGMSDRLENKATNHGFRLIQIIISSSRSSLGWSRSPFLSLRISGVAFPILRTIPTDLNASMIGI